MKVVVTGGAGQLGTNVLRRLARETAIRELVSLDVRPPTVASSKVSHVIADVRDPAIEDCFRGADAVIHLAFIVTKLLNRSDFESINTFGSKNVFERALAAGVRQIVYASSVAAYGVVDRSEPVDEDTPRIRDSTFAYAACKYDVEAFLDELTARHPELLVARMRPSVLMGPRIEHNLGIALRYRTLPALPKPVPMVWDEDVADAFALALLKKAKGGFNLSCDEPLTGEGLARAGGMRIVPLPEGAMRTSMALSDFLADQGIGIDPAWIRASTYELSPYDTRRAKEVLGWQPRYPTGEAVIRRFVETDPGWMDPRLRAFARIASFGAERAHATDSLSVPDTDAHLWLVGPGGGDIRLQVRDGRLAASIGVPRPPQSVAIMRTADFFELASGRTSMAEILSDGRLQIEGNETAMLLTEELVSQLNKQKEAVLALPKKALSFLASRWLK